MLTSEPSQARNGQLRFVIPNGIGDVVEFEEGIFAVKIEESMAREIDCYPCETFLSRKGLSYNEANEISELDILSYYEYLGAFDNKSRLDRRVKIVFMSDEFGENRYL